MKYEVRNMKSDAHRLGWWIEFLLVAAIVLLGLFAWMEDGFGQTPDSGGAGTHRSASEKSAGTHRSASAQNSSGQAVFGPQQANAGVVVE